MKSLSSFTQPHFVSDLSFAAEQKRRMFMRLSFTQGKWIETRGLCWKNKRCKENYTFQCFCIHLQNICVPRETIRWLAKLLLSTKKLCVPLETLRFSPYYFHILYYHLVSNHNIQSIETFPPISFFFFFIMPSILVLQSQADLEKHEGE